MLSHRHNSLPKRQPSCIGLLHGNTILYVEIRFLSVGFQRSKMAIQCTNYKDFIGLVDGVTLHMNNIRSALKLILLLWDCPLMNIDLFFFHLQQGLQGPKVSNYSLL